MFRKGKNNYRIWKRKLIYKINIYIIIVLFLSKFKYNEEEENNLFYTYIQGLETFPLIYQSSSINKGNINLENRN